MRATVSSLNLYGCNTKKMLKLIKMLVFVQFRTNSMKLKKDLGRLGVKLLRAVPIQEQK